MKYKAKATLSNDELVSKKKIDSPTQNQEIQSIKRGKTKEKSEK